MQFTILHGSFGAPEHNWFPWLKTELENLDQEVIIPAFPIESHSELERIGKGNIEIAETQNLENWLEHFEKNVLPKLNSDEKVCFIAHSISPVFLLHIVSRFEVDVDMAIFVAPFLKLPSIDWQYDLVNDSFYQKDFDFREINRHIKNSFSIYSLKDPYVKKEIAEEFANKLNSQKIPFEKETHFSKDFKKFPLVLELCKTLLE